MWKYIAQRLVGAIPTLLVMIFIAFYLVHSAPGGPFDAEKEISAEVKANLDRLYQLDQPLHIQFLNYLSSLIQGDLGPSFRYRDWSVNDLIQTGFPVSLKLGVIAMSLAVVVGCMLGIVSALNRNQILDDWIRIGAVTGIAIPGFVVAPFLILFFAIWLGWLPAGGWQYNRPSDMLMPVATLALPQIAYITKLMRGSMIEVLESSYIRTAKAKGLPIYLIVLRHSIKPAILPVISYLGPASAAIITGSVVIEQIFGIPGMGRYFVQGAMNRDYTLVLGVVVLYGMLILLANLIVDLIYVWLDPKLRYE
ncbi:MAG: oligopeptide ABC transporter permease OppB [Gammaproteobacteria bacterium]|nr:oligopeptide ABC transporter permease OppB [Gammaproteobacteria bacterium]